MMLNNHPRFTIAIPAFKGRFLQECIDSILAQKFEDYEILIVNDNSPEPLKKLVEHYRDQRIMYYENEVGFGGFNVVGNWNKCLEYAHGDYIICMGDDDRLTPDCLSRYDYFISTYPQVKVFHTRTEIIDDRSEFWDLQEARPEWESVYSAIWHRWKGRQQYIGDFLFETGELRKIGGFYCLPYAWGSDDITVWLMAKSNGVVNIPQIGFQYRQSPYTISTNGENIKGKMDAYKLQKEWYSKFLADKPSDLLDQKYCMLLAKRMEKHFSYYAYVYIKQYIAAKPVSGMFYWLRHHSDFISHTKYLRCCLAALKM